MLYLSISNIVKQFGYHHILDGISFVLNMNDRIGLVGANGVGKSTLLNIITGNLEADSGTISIPEKARIGYLHQTFSAPPHTTIADTITQAHGALYDLETELRDLEAQMAQVTGDDFRALMHIYGDKTEQYERMGGYEIDYRVDEVLAGLRIDHLPRTRLVNTLSGGEKSRLALALLLLEAPDFLLLDEPTNHLDFASLTWLESYIRAYRGGVLIVSHDREFLNKTVTSIIEIDEHTRQAKSYRGNYAMYHRAKLAERAKWEADYAEQQDEIRLLRLAIKETAHRNDNYRAHTDSDKHVLNGKIATHANTVSKRIRTAEERLKRIEQHPIPRPPKPLAFRADLSPLTLGGKYPITANGLYKAYGERIILDDVSFALQTHSRVVIVGENGAGKSTLLKILLGLEHADMGEIIIHPQAKIGYLDQENTRFHPNNTLLEAYLEGLEGDSQQLKAMLLQSGLFYYDDLAKPVGKLSSGQARKLQLARLMASRANVLILDEPTNFLSFDVLEEFETALQQFPMPIIAASHDRRFIQQFGGEVWHLADGKLQLAENVI
ncbi:MAG: ABC transporter ATP-binding protein [Phototrophicales bacterium]|nr:MAG: ABC transporter ATP-binding protein [Phototrophicales bacterium]